MLHPAEPHAVVRVLIEDALTTVEELRFTVVSSDDELLVSLRERCDSEAPSHPGSNRVDDRARTEERDGVTFTVIKLPPDRRLRSLTERQKGLRVAQGRRAAAENRSRPRRFRRIAR
jgi:hypothetical protein